MTRDDVNFESVSPDFGAGSAPSRSESDVWLSDTIDVSTALSPIVRAPANSTGIGVDSGSQPIPAVGPIVSRRWVQEWDRRSDDCEEPDRALLLSRKTGLMAVKAAFFLSKCHIVNNVCFPLHSRPALALALIFFALLDFLIPTELGRPRLNLGAGGPERKVRFEEDEGNAGAGPVPGTNMNTSLSVPARDEKLSILPARPADPVSGTMVSVAMSSALMVGFYALTKGLYLNGSLCYV